MALVPYTGVAGADPDFRGLEPDARTVPWHTLDRLALQAGFFPPLYRSQTSAELAARLDPAALAADPAQQAEARFWRHRFLSAGGGRTWTGCDCRTHPWSLRVQGRVITGFSELGDILPGEAGLAWAPGWNAVFEPSLDWSAGAFWATVTWRLNGRVSTGGRTYREDEPLAWPRWRPPTGRDQVRAARLSDGPWQGDLPQLLVGARLGRWSLSAGWAARRTGPGLSGALVLDHGGASFPAVTARRTSPFRWSGVMTHLAPDDLLLRAGLLSEREIRYGDNSGRHSKTARPWFFQWLLGYEVTGWFRTTFTHTVMATPREGTLWPDLMQVNFPVIGTTWREQESGPITDRLFAVQLEARWRGAPWPLLPAQAGRVYWDYGGTDFLPSGPWGVVPEISIPASVAGCELLGPSWDLGLEYAETYHTEGLWYSNSGFPSGYTQRGWLLGHPMGGAAEAVTALLRVRPRAWPLEAVLTWNRTRWDHPNALPGTAERSSLSLAVGKRPGRDAGAVRLNEPSPLLWQITAEYLEEEVAPTGAEAGATGWGRVYLRLGI